MSPTLNQPHCCMKQMDLLSLPGRRSVCSCSVNGADGSQFSLLGRGGTQRGSSGLEVWMSMEPEGVERERESQNKNCVCVCL